MIEYCTSIDLPTGVLGCHCCRPLMASYTSSREQCLIASIYFILFEFIYLNILRTLATMTICISTLSCGVSEWFLHLLAYTYAD